MDAKGVKKQSFSHTLCSGQICVGSKILQENTELFDECIRIDAVCIAGLLERLSAGQRTAEAVHADVLEHGHGLGGILEDLADHGVFRDFKHIGLPPIKEYISKK